MLNHSSYIVLTADQDQIQTLEDVPSGSAIWFGL